MSDMVELRQKRAFVTDGSGGTTREQKVIWPTVWAVHHILRDRTALFSFYIKLSWSEDMKKSCGVLMGSDSDLPAESKGNQV